MVLIDRRCTGITNTDHPISADRLDLLIFTAQN